MKTHRITSETFRTPGDDPSIPDCYVDPKDLATVRGLTGVDTLGIMERFLQRQAEEALDEAAINEVADNPYKYFLQSNRREKFVGIFLTQDGTRMQVNVTTDPNDPNTVDVGFYDDSDRNNPTIGITGKGDAFRILSTVGSVLKDYVAKFKPIAITYSGKSDDGGRIKLYDTIAKNMGRYLPGYQQVNANDTDGNRQYRFQRESTVSEMITPIGNVTATRTAGKITKTRRVEPVEPAVRVDIRKEKPRDPDEFVYKRPRQQPPSEITESLPNDVEKAVADMRKLAGIDKPHGGNQSGQDSPLSAAGTAKIEYMKKNDIAPGTDAWFRLWFSRPGLTGENPMPLDKNQDRK